MKSIDHDRNKSLQSLTKSRHRPADSIDKKTRRLEGPTDEPLAESEPPQECATWMKAPPVRVNQPSQAALLPNKIFLEDQRTARLRAFRCVKDEDVFCELYANPSFQNLNRQMLKQNVEADFETDEEQIRKANEMMRNDLIESISFCVTQDPFTLVNNIRFHDPAYRQ